MREDLKKKNGWPPRIRRLRITLGAVFAYHEAASASGSTSVLIASTRVLPVARMISSQMPSARAAMRSRMARTYTARRFTGTFTHADCASRASSTSPTSILSSRLARGVRVTSSPSITA